MTEIATGFENPLIITLSPNGSLFLFDQQLGLWELTHGSKYKIVKTVVSLPDLPAFPVLDTTGNPLNPDDLSIQPSLNKCGAAPQDDEYQFIWFQCVNTALLDSSGNPTPVPDCSISGELALGTDHGGHEHTGGIRPLGKIGPFGLVSPLPLAPIVMPKEGVVLAYLAPEIAGDAKWSFSATDPNGANLEVADTVFHVHSSVQFAPLTVTDSLGDSNLDFNVDSHTGDGFWGTAAMRTQVVAMIARYYKLRQAASPLNIDVPESQGASLSEGGLFDKDDDWRTPHCAHRNGQAIDISLSNLTDDERRALRDAIKFQNLSFYPPESPATPSADHWHAMLGKSGVN